MKLLKVCVPPAFYFCLLVPAASFGQEQSSLPDQNTEVRTLLKVPKISSIGVYAIPEFQYGSLAGQFTPMGGGSVMLSLNKKLGIGVSGYTTFENFTPSQLSPTNALQLNAHFGGGRIEYTLNPNSPVHISFPLLIGGGRANIDSAGRGSGREGRELYSGNGSRYNEEHGSKISFFMIQPGINIEANVVKFVKIFAGASYRIVSGGSSQTSNISSFDAPLLGQFQGLSFNAGIKIGHDFQKHRKP